MPLLLAALFGLVVGDGLGGLCFGLPFYWWLNRPKATVGGSRPGALSQPSAT